MPDGPFTVKLTGHIELMQAFRALRSELPKDPTRKPLREAGSFLTAQIQQAVPETRGKPTGRLLAAIRLKIGRAKGATHARITVGGGGFYWRFLELGWRAHGTGTWFQFPFIKPTTQRLQQQTGQIVINGCEREIEKAARRLCIKTARGI